MVVVCALYSQWKDPKTDVQFERRLVGLGDKAHFVGVAEVEEEKAKAFKHRDGFHVYTKDDFAALNTLPEYEAPISSGDPLTDAHADAHTPLTEAGIKAMEWNDLLSLAKERGVNIKTHKTKAAVTAALLEIQAAANEAAQETESETEADQATATADGAAKTAASPLAGAPPPPPGSDKTDDKTDAENASE